MDYTVFRKTVKTKSKTKRVWYYTYKDPSSGDAVCIANKLFE